ncbi:MAG: hypothetical protein M3178_05875 [Pseudomonadota bacterium]|nr:hypothetical protein [Pseudomonadota bacterium]
MTAAILVRDHFDGSTLRLPARQSRDAGQTRRLLSPLKDGAGRGLRWRLAVGRPPRPPLLVNFRWLIRLNHCSGCVDFFLRVVLSSEHFSVSC